MVVIVFRQDLPFILWQYFVGVQVVSNYNGNLLAALKQTALTILGGRFLWSMGEGAISLIQPIAVVKRSKT